MKTFGELQVGDYLYTLNAPQHEWGEIVKCPVTQIVHRTNGIFADITISDYTQDPFTVRARETGTSGDVSPSMEGLVQYWRMYIFSKIEMYKSEIEGIKNRINLRYHDLEVLEKIASDTDETIESQ